MTPREFWNACKGYRDKLQDEYRTSWERSRWVGAMALNATSSKQIKPRQLLPFPWEKDETTHDFSEEIETIKKRRDAINSSRINSRTEVK